MSEINKKLAKRIVKAAKQRHSERGEPITYEQVLELLRTSGVPALREVETRNPHSPLFPEIPKSYTLPPKTEKNWNRAPLGLKGDDLILESWDFTKYPLLSITGNPGSGKTSMLSNINQWLQGNPHTKTYYLNFLYPGFPNDKGSLTLLRESLEQRLRADQSPTVLLVDSPTSSPAREEFLDELIRLLDYYPHLSMAVNSQYPTANLRNKASQHVLYRTDLYELARMLSPELIEVMKDWAETEETTLGDAYSNMTLGTAFTLRKVQGQWGVTPLRALPPRGTSLDELAPRVQDISTYEMTPAAITPRGVLRDYEAVDNAGENIAFSLQRLQEVLLEVDLNALIAETERKAEEEEEAEEMDE